MQIVRTELKWHYEPGSFLEAGVHESEPEFALTVEGGLAQAVLNQPLDPVPADFISRVRAKIQAILDARQLLIHESYQLDEHPLIVHQRPDGTSNQVLTVGTAVLKIRANPPDIIVTDSTGKVVRDTKAERLTEHGSFIASVSEAAGRSPLLRSLLASYRAAVNDPADELVHLYEIRDALKEHYGGEAKARQALNITRKQWQELGEIANDRPVEQSRHRGQHVAARRPATLEELEAAQAAARRLIEAFARTV